MQTVTLIYLIGFAAIFYLFILRPQQKQQKKRLSLISSLQAQDRIVTIGGLYGTVKEVKDQTIIIQIADNVEVEILKSAVAYTLAEEQKETEN